MYVNLYMYHPKISVEFIALHYFPILSAYLNDCRQLVLIVLIYDFTRPDMILDVSSLS